MVGEATAEVEDTVGVGATNVPVSTTTAAEATTGLATTTTDPLPLGLTIAGLGHLQAHGTITEETILGTITAVAVAEVVAVADIEVLVVVAVEVDMGKEEGKAARAKGLARATAKEKAARVTAKVVARRKSSVCCPRVPVTARLLS